MLPSHRLGLGIALLCLFACASAQTSQYCTTPTCANTVGSKTSFLKSSSSLTDQLAQVFLWVAQTNSTDNSTILQKAPFYPRVDEFSVMTVNNSGLLFLNDSSTRIYLSIGNVTSTAKRYTNNAVFVSYWTAYIQLNNGVVRSITWDDDPTCSLCVQYDVVSGQHLRHSLFVCEQ
eukprot:EC725809.1.p1 GENE.EC725809.1~~EC725809.1.p1  ORF type:complete len:175 (+),score=4.23 EC725809.1:81-605(+)